jgi:hypothetical protein
MELDQPNFAFKPGRDARPHMPEPPPVRIVAVEDVTLPASSGQEADLDAFYIGLLEFERDDKSGGLVYKAENLRLRFNLVEGPIVRGDYRALTVEVRDLRLAEKKLVDEELEYERHKGLTPGQERLLLLDPAGNIVELVVAPRVA